MCCLVLCFDKIRDYARSKRRKLQDLAVNKEHVVPEESSANGVHNPIELHNQVSVLPILLHFVLFCFVLFCCGFIERNMIVATCTN